jgi:8-oxo-dGTP diphosphatase
MKTRIPATLPEECRRLTDAATAEGIEAFAVGAGLLHSDNILVVFRSDEEDFLPGHAELPGGGVEAGETLLDALAREVLEETGLGLGEVLGVTGRFDYRSGSGRLTRQVNFLARVNGADVRLNPAEHSRLVWLPLDDAESLAGLPLTPEMVATLAEMRSFSRRGSA